MRAEVLAVLAVYVATIALDIVLPFLTPVSIAHLAVASLIMALTAMAITHRPARISISAGALATAIRSIPALQGHKLSVEGAFGVGPITMDLITAISIFQSVAWITLVVVQTIYLINIMRGE